MIQLKQKKYKSDCSPVSGSRLMVIIFGSFITMNCCNTSYKTKRIVEMIFCVIVVTQMKMQLNCILYRYSTLHYRISRKCTATWKLWFGTTVSVKKILPIVQSLVGESFLIQTIFFTLQLSSVLPISLNSKQSNCLVFVVSKFPVVGANRNYDWLNYDDLGGTKNC